jgi:protein-tyrosine-phosphatase
MTTVLFVCVENAGRSQMAEGFARALAREAGLPLEVWSAGSRPSGVVNPTAVAVMRECGVEIGAQHSKGLDAIPSRRWDWLVTMGCGDACPTTAVLHREDWDLPDPQGQSVESVQNLLDRYRANAPCVDREA